MNFRQSLFSVGAILLLISLSLPALAHRAWIIPSTSNLSGESPWVSFDAAVSNTLFVAEHVPLRTSEIVVLNPKGETLSVSNPHTGKYKSVFDVNLATPGAYKVVYSNNGLRASWKDDEGDRKRWPARGQLASDADFATSVPSKASDLQVYENFWRLETFVSSGEPTTEILKPTGLGLELLPVTHPNDLFAGETAKFQLLFNGEPAAKAKVSFVAGHMRYRNEQEQINLESDAQGYITVTWPYAGMYLFEAEFQDDKAKAPATTRRGKYAATFDVLPL